MSWLCDLLSNYCWFWNDCCGFAWKQSVSLRLLQAFDIGCRNDASQVVGKRRVTLALHVTMHLFHMIMFVSVHRMNACLFAELLATDPLQHKYFKAFAQVLIPCAFPRQFCA